MKKSSRFIAGLLIVGIVFIIKLFYLQVVNETYKIEAYKVSSKRIVEYPQRGHIYDRQGNIIVANQAEYSLTVVPRDMKGIDSMLLCSLLRIDKQMLISKLKKASKYSNYRPSLFVDKMDKLEYGRIKEFLFEFKGLFVQKKYVRQYPFGVGGNVVGFLGEVSTPFFEGKEDGYYEKGDMIGTSGIEKSYEIELRGRKGMRYVHVNKFNVEKEYVLNIPSEPGNDIVSTVDINLQEYGEKLMKNKKGSIVAIDPKTGEILALVSSPSYNPNLLVGKQRNKNYTKLENDSIGLPLFDKSILAEYPPGSLFKIVVGLIGLQERVISGRTTFKCLHGFRYGKLEIDCHCGVYDKKMDIHEAVYKSCNNYFLNVYRRTIEKYHTAKQGYSIWRDHVNSFNLGKFLNNDIPTGRKGLVPSADYYDRIYGNGKWEALYNISNAIGQGEILSTPIQLANLAAIIANRGYYYTPHVVRLGTKKFSTKRRTTIDAEHFETLINGMYSVMEEGTARGSRIKGIEVCGKTGTAENPHGQDHSMFMAFAPKDNPKIAIAVVVENGYWGSRWAAPISTLVIEKYLKGTTYRRHLEKSMLGGDLRHEYVNKILVEK